MKDFILHVLCEYNTCQSIEDNQLILDKFHCHIPILYSGHHLDDFISKDVLNCSQDATGEGLDLILKKETKCKQTQTCEMTRFTSTYTVQETQKEHEIWVLFSNPEVLYQNTYISYDLISLFGEIGGIIGITLKYFSSFAAVKIGKKEVCTIIC